MSTTFLKIVAISFAVYIGSCVYFERLRKDFPEMSVQAHAVNPIEPPARCNTIKTAITNLAVGVLIFILISRWVKLDWKSNLIFLEIAKLAAMFFISDTMFYWSHRLLHVSAVYKIAHAQHHSHNEPISWTSLYVHPVEFIIAFIGIFAVPLLVFKMHPATATLFLCGIMLALTSSHSGFNHGGSVLDATHHDLHHQRRRGNYGSGLGIWDKLCGTVLQSPR